ncbi:MAG: hypothetical protein ACREFV_02735 [Acetobacteraceae bacterium]
MQWRRLGAFPISRGLAYSGPTHAAEFPFPGEDHTALEAGAAWLAPRHYVPSIRKSVVTVQL